jgi:selenocysteine lyase/cysteine desulfurase
VGRGRSYISIVALCEATRFINSIGIEIIESHVLSVEKNLIDKLSSEGYNVYGYTSDKKHWPGISLVKTGLEKGREIR